MGLEALVSIVIPVYKVEPYIHKCIESIFDQTYRNLEIILVDDGSPDACPMICDKYACQDKRVQVVHKSNGGLSDARNVGIDMAKGDFIAFVDSDDYVAPDMVKTLLQLALNERADITVCNYCRVFPDGREIKRGTKAAFKRMNNIEAMEDVFSSPSLCEVMTWNKLYSVALFKENGIRFPINKIHEDNFTTYKLLYAAQKIVYTDAVLYYYVQRADSIMNAQFNYKRLDLLEAVQEAKDFVRDHQLSLTQQVDNYEMMMQFNILNSLLYAKNQKNLWQQVQRDILSSFEPLLHNPFVSNRHKIGLMLLKFRIYKISMRLYNTLDKKGISVGIKGLIVKCIKSFMAIIFRAQVKQARASKRPVAFVLGTPLHHNIGDQAITCAELSFLKKYFREYSTVEIPIFKESFFDDHLDLLRDQVQAGDLLLCHGGGNIGDEYEMEEVFRRKVIKLFPDFPLIVFPQTMSFSNTEKGNQELEVSKKIYGQHSHLVLFAREQYSYDTMQAAFPRNKIYLCPDMVLMLNETNLSLVRKGASLFLRNDVEGTLSGAQKDVIHEMVAKEFGKCRVSDTLSKSNYIFPANRNKIFQSKLDEFRCSELVVTDRLHGMVLSAITSTPCIALSNYNNKVRGTYEWIESLPYIKFADSLEEIPSLIKELKQLQNPEYHNQALISYFDELRDVILRNQENE